MEKTIYKCFICFSLQIQLPVHRQNRQFFYKTCLPDLSDLDPYWVKLVSNVLKTGPDLAPLASVWCTHIEIAHPEFGDLCSFHHSLDDPALEALHVCHDLWHELTCGRYNVKCVNTTYNTPVTCVTTQQSRDL